MVERGVEAKAARELAQLHRARVRALRRLQITPLLVGERQLVPKSTRIRIETRQ